MPSDRKGGHMSTADAVVIALMVIQILIAYKR